MKKYNRMFACPTPSGECYFIIAKSRNHMEKIYKKSKVRYEPEDFEDWGKFTDVAIKWDTTLKKLVQKSGLCYFVSYGKAHNCIE